MISVYLNVLLDDVGYVLCFVFTDCHLMPLLHPLYAQEAAKLFVENVVKQTVSRTMFDPQGRFACLSS